jgi:hypothetical protein
MKEPGASQGQSVPELISKRIAELNCLTGGDVIRMVMILRENRLIRLKVNPVTSQYSLVEFRRVAAELARQL